MAKILFLLLIGFAAGYSYGFRDAKVNETDVVTRTVERVRAAAGGKYNQDVDSQLDRMERR